MEARPADAGTLVCPLDLDVQYAALGIYSPDVQFDGALGCAFVFHLSLGALNLDVVALKNRAQDIFHRLDFFIQCF